MLQAEEKEACRSCGYRNGNGNRSNGGVGAGGDDWVCCCCCYWIVGRSSFLRVRPSYKKIPGRPAYRDRTLRKNGFCERAM